MRLHVSAHDSSDQLVHLSNKPKALSGRTSALLYMRPVHHLQAYLFPPSDSIYNCEDSVIMFVSQLQTVDSQLQTSVFCSAAGCIEVSAVDSRYVPTRAVQHKKRLRNWP